MPRLAQIRRVFRAIIVTCCLVSTRLYAQSSNVDRVTGWRNDITFWLDQIRQQHYVYKSKALPPALVTAAADLSRNVPRYSDERMLFEMQRLAAYIGDGHTYVLPLAAQRVPGSVIPLRFYLFSDGLYVIDAQKGHERWIGSQLVRIGNTSTDKLLAGMKTAISADNPFAYKWIGPPFLNVRGALESLAEGIGRDGISVTLRGRDGRVEALNFATVPPPRMQGVPKLIPSRITGSQTPLWLRDVSRNYWFTSLGNRTLYVQFNQVMDAENETLKQFAARLRDTLTARHPAVLILDVRHNNGGNSYLYPPLIDVLREYESSAPSNKLYVLTGRNTFSAAQNFIAQLDKRTHAIFVGEPSSSRPNFVGEENNLVLPWSGAIVSISNRYHENIPGDTRRWIEPDIRVELGSRDYFAGRDPVLEKVLALNR
jgi:hypothetical protein